MASGDQIARILALAHELATSKRGVSLRVLAERKGWRPRSLYRDIAALQAAGFPVVSEGNRYRLAEGWAPPNTGAATGDEVAALFVMRQITAGIRPTGIARALDRLWAKLSPRRAGQQELFPRATPPGFATRTTLGIDYTAHRRIVGTLERAITDRVAVRCRYQALSTNQATSRVIEPGDLYWDPGLETLYLIGWCRLRQSVRVFAVHRFRACVLSDEHFAPRPEAQSRTALRHAFRVWRADHTDTVRIHFSPTIAPEIRERRWHKSQRIEEEADGSLVLTLEVAGLPEVEHWVLGYADHAQVLAPLALAENVGARLTAAAASYAGAKETVSRDDKARAHRNGRRR